MPEQTFQVRLLDHGAAASQIHGLFQRSYAVEAALLKLNNFPPLARTPADIENAESEFLGVFAGDSLIAAAELERDPDQVIIASLVVDPDFFRRAIARKLMEHVIAGCHDQALYVETATANLPALRLYKAAGFRLVSEFMTSDGIRKARLRHISNV